MASSPNPIYDQYFEGRAMLAGKVFDNPRSVQFRKHLIMNTWLQETKPSSIPSSKSVERRGTCMNFHVLWLQNEGNALRESALYRQRAQRKMQAADAIIKSYLNKVNSVLNKLRK